MTLDDLRRAQPHLGFAVYAYEPGGDVTFEIMAGEQSFTWRAPTVAEALAMAYPGLAIAAPEPDIFE